MGISDEIEVMFAFTCVLLLLSFLELFVKSNFSVVINKTRWSSNLSPFAVDNVAPPTQTFLGVGHAFLPHERLPNLNSFPIVRKYRPEITCRLSEIQSALLKSKCWQAKHIRTSSVECETWPKIFAPDENIGDKRWLFVYLISLYKGWIRCRLLIKLFFGWCNGGVTL